MSRPLTVTALLALVDRQARIIESLVSPTVKYVVAPTSEPTSELTGLPENVASTCRMMAGGNDAMLAYLEGLAQEMLDDGMDDILVARTIAQGVQE